MRNIIPHVLVFLDDVSVHVHAFEHLSCVLDGQFGAVV